MDIMDLDASRGKMGAKTDTSQEKWKPGQTSILRNVKAPRDTVISRMDIHQARTESTEENMKAKRRWRS
jgi:hypothetical protein